LPALAALLLYARTIAFAFVWDDLDLVVRNAALQQPGWERLLLTDFWASTGGGTGMWRPLVTLSYRVDGVFSHWQPWAFHAVNALAHAVSAALVGRLALTRGLGVAAAAAAGLLFASAPALAESVAWIAGRTDAFLVLAALGALLAAARWRASGSRASLAAVAACTALALLSKETALVLPLLLAADAADAAARPAPARAPARAWPVGASLAVVVLWAFVHRTLVGAPEHPPAPGALLGVAALVWAHLAWLTPWAPHAPLLPLWSLPAEPVAWAAWLGLAAVLVAGLMRARRRQGGVLPLALLFAPLLPVAAASLLEAGVRFAERSLALSAVGFALAVASLAALAPARLRTTAAVVVGLWLVAQAVISVPVIEAWRDEESRIRRVVQVRPADTDALLGLADLLSTLGRTQEAREWIARAAGQVGAEADVALASLEFRSGHFEDALAAAERAEAAEPGGLAAGVIRVRSLSRLGRASEAVAAGEALVAAHPGEPAGQGALGAAWLAAGDPARARPLLQAASSRLPDDAGLAWDLGRAAIATGDVRLAREAFERVVLSLPDSYEGWLGVADTRSRLGDSTGAAQALVRAESMPAASDGRARVLRQRLSGR
jgi:tetratricopeptide (TPR) repeat protein